MTSLDPKTAKKKIEGFFSFVSGILGILSFLLDHPTWAFIAVIAFGLGIYLYSWDDLNKLVLESKSNRTSKLRFWLRKLSSNWLVPTLIFVGIIVVTLMGQFLYKQVYYLVRQGWVERVNFEYQNGMAPIHLSSLKQNRRVLEVLTIIDPVIYHNQGLFISNEISFEGKVTPVSDFGNGSFEVELAGLDPLNSILEPAGNFTSNLSGEQYQKFTFENQNTYFIRILPPETQRYEYIRLHFIEREIVFLGTLPTTKMTVYVSYLYNGEDRFDGLVTP